jgi:hypothetical protein
MPITKQRLTTSMIAVLGLLFTGASMAETDHDCLLEGTVQKSDSTDAADTQVKFYSVKKYDESSKCRVHRDRKLEFKLPDDPRLKDAPDGSSVKYRYRTNEQGEVSTELINIST